MPKAPPLSLTDVDVEDITNKVVQNIAEILDTPTRLRTALSVIQQAADKKVAVKDELAFIREVTVAALEPQTYRKLN